MISDLVDHEGVSDRQAGSHLSRVGTVAVVIPLGHDWNQHLSDPFFSAFIRTVMDELTAHGLAMTVIRANSSEHPDWLDKLATSGKYDGILVVGQSDQFNAIERVAKVFHPLVVWGAHVGGQCQCSVGSDNEKGGAIAIQHLIDRGCRSIALLGNDQAIEVAQRFAGAEAAARQSTVDVILVRLQVHFSDEDMTREIKRYLDEMDEAIDGVFAASDLIAITTIGLLRQRGKRVPEDISVIGFDNLPISSAATPALTTIRQDITRGAVAAVTKLRERIMGRVTSSLVMVPELVVRET